MRKLFDIVRDDVWTVTKHAQQPFTYGSPPGREDFYFAGQIALLIARSAYARLEA